MTLNMLSTLGETSFEAMPIHSACMEESTDGLRYPAKPIFDRIGPEHGAQSAFAEKLKVTIAVTSMWKKRNSIPPRRLGDALNAAEMPLVEYIRATGLPERSVSFAIVGPSPMFNRVAKAFLSLPPGLQEYLARKSEELADYASAIPPLYRDSLSPPDDQEAYWEWEHKVRQAIKDRVSATRPSTPPAKPVKKR